MKKLYFIAGRRKAGTTLLFHSLDVDWRAPGKDQSWSIVEGDVDTFVSSDAETGVIAKADALSDWNRLYAVANHPSLDATIFDLHREPVDQFLSYAGHERKKWRRGFADMALQFQKENDAFDDGVEHLLRRGVDLVQLNYEDVVKGDLDSGIGFKLLPTERRFNARSHVLPFYGILSSFVQSRFYQKFRSKNLFVRARSLYYRFFARSKAKNHFVNLWIVSVGRKWRSVRLSKNSESSPSFSSRFFALKSTRHFRFFLIVLEALFQVGFWPLRRPDFIVFFVSEPEQARSIRKRVDLFSGKSFPAAVCIASRRSGIDCSETHATGPIALEFVSSVWDDGRCESSNLVHRQSFGRVGAGEQDSSGSTKFFSSSDTEFWHDLEEILISTVILSHQRTTFPAGEEI